MQRADHHVAAAEPERHAPLECNFHDSGDWVRNAALPKAIQRHAINGAANPSLTLSNVQPSSAGDSSVLVTNALGSAISAAATLTVAAPPALLINVDFGAGTNTTKTGPAALRQAANDFWNFYTRDGPGGGWLSYGTLVNLKQANGADTQTGMIVENAPGAWALGSSDPMYDSYIYPFGAGSAIITIT